MLTFVITALGKFGGAAANAHVDSVASSKVSSFFIPASRSSSS
jgi:hypothetical protein